MEPRLQKSRILLPKLKLSLQNAGGTGGGGVRLIIGLHITINVNLTLLVQCKLRIFQKVILFKV